MSEDQKIKRRLYIREYQRTHKEKRKEICKRYAEKNRERKLLSQKEYREKNKNKIAELNREYRKDLNVRIRGNLRHRIWCALRGVTKVGGLYDLLGCTREELIQHLESKFQEGMSWDNYGFHGWHVDHIRPCASFDLSDPEQQKQCFHYTNLQPLWAKDNHSKHHKYDNQVR